MMMSLSPTVSSPRLKFPDKKRRDKFPTLAKSNYRSPDQKIGDFTADHYSIVISSVVTGIFVPSAFSKVAPILCVGCGVPSDLKLFCEINVSNPGVVEPLGAIIMALPLLCDKFPPVILNPGLGAWTVNEPSPNSR